MTSSPDLNRQPCPDRILEDVGNAFGMGTVGGSLFHFVKGLRNSPNGHRLAGGATAVRMNAPRIGGNFAVWGALFSTFDCAMVYARKKEDPWNSIVAGAATGGLLQLRKGILATGRGAVFGGAILALIEGAGIMLNRCMVNTAPPPEDLMMQQQYPAGQDPAAQYVPPGFLGVPPAAPIVVEEVPVVPDSGRAGWFGGLFGRKQQDKVASGDRRCEELELDLPSTAVPSFD
jgi:import inner membrane translocase subunit TIM17